ncbi:MAG: EAL domain-containing protein [Gammaproteobacteria bacterium]|nr:EAL domain-containing protein [Gammaproteobacteria bacterium]
MTIIESTPLLPARLQKQLRLLLVEDNPGDELLFRALIGEATQKTVCVEGAQSMAAATRKLAGAPYDAIITDLDLPDSEGLETLSALLAVTKTTPIVVLTHCEDEDFALELLKHGAEDYLVKGRSEGPLILKTIRYAIERKEAEQHFLQLSYYDKLTGLANRELFRDRLRQAMVRATRSAQLVAVLFLDLDRFKAVNDTLGHLAGDELLVEVAVRLQGCVRKADTIARLGGDEFTIVLEDIDHPSFAEAICRKIIEALQAPITVQRHELYVTTSIGVTFFPTDDVDLNGLLRNADAAMYRAKDQGRNKYHLFTADLGAEAVRRMTIEAALRHAIDRNELFLCYQPKIELKTGAVIGAEALLRWRHPELGLIAPAQFIPVAEETGLIVPVGAWVLRQACADARRWHNLGISVGRVAVNLSARQFRGGDLCEFVRTTTAAAGLEPAFLELEITESLLMEDTTASCAALSELKNQGFGIYLDDFGTGYSSLAYLKKFQLDGLKIDRSFIRDLPTDSDDEAITRAILALSQALHLKVVAEGVETVEQHRFLQKVGCGAVQGYFYSRPLVYDEFMAWLIARESGQKSDSPGFEETELRVAS